MPPDFEPVFAPDAEDEVAPEGAEFAGVFRLKA